MPLATSSASFLSVNWFIMYLLRASERHFDPFCLFEHFRGLLAVSIPGTSIGVDLTLGHFKQLSGEPRRIEILGQQKISHF